jgi:hypothetical protein
MDTSVTTNRPSTAALKNECHGTSYIVSGAQLVCVRGQAVQAVRCELVCTTASRSRDHENNARLRAPILTNHASTLRVSSKQISNEDEGGWGVVDASQYELGTSCLGWVAEVTGRAVLHDDTGGPKIPIHSQFFRIISSQRAPNLFSCLCHMCRQRSIEARRHQWRKRAGRAHGERGQRQPRNLAGGMSECNNLFLTLEGRPTNPCQWERYDRHEVEASEEEMALLGTVAGYCQHSNTCWAQLGAQLH